MGWTTYMAAFLLSVCMGQEEPLFWANRIVLTAALVFLAVIYWRRDRKDRKGLFSGIRVQGEKENFGRGAVFFILFVFLSWIMFYVFYIKDGTLYSGFTVYGDYAPHTAMMRSFSRGNNFPTQYPHFGGEDVKYHFMFQFLIGTLEYLGLRLDVAYNMMSVFSLLGFLMLLYCLAGRITKSRKAGVLTVVFFFFRSSLTFSAFCGNTLRREISFPLLPAIRRLSAIRLMKTGDCGTLTSI